MLILGKPNVTKLLIFQEFLTTVYQFIIEFAFNFVNEVLMPADLPKSSFDRHNTNHADLLILVS
jgi:hypothetical protein